MKIAIIGTGYVGLVTGTCLAEIGHDVTCVDIDEAKIKRLAKGDIPIYEPGLSELVHKNVAAERLHFTTNYAKIGAPEAIFFALPTPPNGDGEADLSFVLAAAKSVAKVMKGYTVLINKSTVPVGTAKKVRAMVEELTKVPFDVVSNPEFLREGFAVTDFMQSDRIVVGSSSPKARAVMEEIYQPFTNAGVPLMLMDEASSEMTKYAANSFLAAKISFMNEIANLCEIVGADVDLVREGVGSDERIGRRFLYAGLGYGGSCFPKDVLALHRVAAHNDYDFKMLTAVMDVNERQRLLMVEKITDRLGESLEGVKVAVWGLAFKPDTDDIREAPAIAIIRDLLGRGAKVRAYDPEAMENTKRIIDGTIDYAESALDAIKGADVLVIATEWKEFATVAPDVIAKALRKKMIFDGRNLFTLDDMQKADLTYVSIGRKAVERA
jgi:UDPglucose 6-dehydrogenase